jgi:hypothetical protein
MLNGVLHIPGVLLNLISASLLEKEGFYYDGKNHILTNGSQELCVIDLKEGLYNVRANRL